MIDEYTILSKNQNGEHDLYVSGKAKSESALRDEAEQEAKKRGHKIRNLTVNLKGVE